METDTYPLVSIAIPTYQGEEFLGETIATALSQTYPNIEILISDDGSTDKTLEIARDYQKQSSVEFRILTHHHLGMVNNWNFCISMSQGKYIKFLFQDDLLMPNCLEEMVSLAQKDDEIGLVFSPRGIILAKDAESHEYCLCIYRNCDNLDKAWSNLQSIQSGFDLLQDPNLLEHPMNKIGEPSTVLIRREVFEQIGGFDSNLCQIVDVDMWLRIMGNYKIGYINKKLSYFRIHPQQQSIKNADSGEMFSDSERFNSKILIDPCYGNLLGVNKEKIYRRVIANLEHQYDTISKAEIKKIQEWGDYLENELKLTQQELGKTKANLAFAQEMIEGMESSKFWKIRSLWFKVKDLFTGTANKSSLDHSSLT